jgi:N-acetylmuramic acid 6-phosphate etherase
MDLADAFLNQVPRFALGELPTETPHPLTRHLSRLAQTDLDHALALLRQVDRGALERVQQDFARFAPLFSAIAGTLEQGNRIYLVGCGATGRLALSLEFLWRRKHPGSDQVRSLMAGGDVALVHSLEGFEDFPEFGARHLGELGFVSGDLLIGTTEGGETPYVIGAVEAAAQAAGANGRAPFFLYCNPRALLIEKVERSRRILLDEKVRSIAVETGPMALTGSTRMQASTVLMLVVGLALEFQRDVVRAKNELDAWLLAWAKSPLGWLKNFIVEEAQTYLDGDFTCYTASDFAMTVFTDTTERSPTFNLAPFDNPSEKTQRRSLTYLALPKTDSADDAWNALLARAPRPLEWPEVHPKTSKEYLYSFDFSRNALEFRKALLPGRTHFPFAIESVNGKLQWQFRDLNNAVSLSGQSALFDHLSLKMLLNMHSTLVMGRLGRFEGNLMTWVYPSNGKLVDRAARYTQILLAARGRAEFGYDEIVRAQFALKAGLTPKESIVHKTIERLTGERYTEV